MIIAKDKVLDAYQRAIELGAASHEEAVACAAQALGVQAEIVEEAVWDREATA